MGAYMCAYNNREVYNTMCCNLCMHSKSRWNHAMLIYWEAWFLEWSQHSGEEGRGQSKKSRHDPTKVLPTREERLAGSGLTASPFHIPFTYISLPALWIQLWSWTLPEMSLALKTGRQHTHTYTHTIDFLPHGQPVPQTLTDNQLPPPPTYLIGFSNFLY